MSVAVIEEPRALSPINAGRVRRVVGKVTHYPLVKKAGGFWWDTEGAEGLATLTREGLMSSLDGEVKAGVETPLHYHFYSTKTISVTSGDLELEWLDHDSGEWVIERLSSAAEATVPALAPHTVRYITDTKVTLAFDPPMEVSTHG